MLELWVTNSLNDSISSNNGPAYFLASRKLSQGEIKFLKKKNISRFYLQTLNSLQQEIFLKELDLFWDQLVADFGPDHQFWRNVVSSKMQEWEGAACYLAVSLFALTQMSLDATQQVLIITNSVEEEAVWEDWAQKHGWIIHKVHQRVPRRVRCCIQGIKNGVLFLKLCVKAIQGKIFSPPFPKGLSSVSEKGYLLIASLFYPWSFQGTAYQDPFFGDIHKYSPNQGEEFIYLGDMLSQPNSRIKRAIQECRDVNVLILYSLLSWRDLISILWKVLFQKVLVTRCCFLGCDFSSLIQWNSRRCSYHFNFHAEMFFEVIKKLCQRYPIKRFLYIFEGNVFERACVQAVRQYSSAKVCGYNQGVIFESNLKLHLTNNEKLLKPEPDHIICTGSYAKDLFSRVGNRQCAQLTAGCALREIPSVICEQSPLKLSGNILVALDGVYSTVSVFDWLCEHSAILEDFNVCIRAHPNVSIEEIMSQSLQTMPKNFTISCDSLETDLRRCWCVFYRHTSIGIQALLNGIPAIHLAVDVPLSGDPIEDLKSGKWVAHTPEELRIAIEKIRCLTSEDNSTMLNEAKNFLKGYFTPPTQEKLCDFVNI